MGRILLSVVIFIAAATAVVGILLRGHIAENFRMNSVAEKLESHPALTTRFASPIKVHRLDSGGQPSAIHHMTAYTCSRFEVVLKDGTSETIWVSWAHACNSQEVFLLSYSDTPGGSQTPLD
jgi:hypothetical protein